MKCARGIFGITLALALIGSTSWGQTGDSSTMEKVTVLPNSRVDSRPFQTFYLVTATQQNDALDVVTAVRNIMPADVKIYWVSGQNAIVMRANPDELMLAQKVINDLDRPKKLYRLTYTIIEMDGALLFISAADEGMCLAVLADTEADAGLIAYEMVTGRRPFPAENAIQMITLQQLPVRVKPSDLRPSLPLAAENLILQSIELEPSKRPQSAKAFGDRLHDALIGATVYPFSTVPASAPSSPSVTVPPLPEVKGKSSKKPWALAIAALAIVSGMYKEWKKPPSGQPAAQTTEPSQNDDSIELAFWNSVKDSPEPRLYREYLAKYPSGKFASLASAKIDILSKKETPQPPVPKATQPKTVAAATDTSPKKTTAVVESHPPATPASTPPAAPAAPAPAPEAEGPNFRRKLPDARPALDPASYHGPMEGEIRWTGRVFNNTGLVIQAGHANTGTITGDLPRVPVTIELSGDKGTLVAVPARRNQWDHIAVRNLSGGPMKQLTIHWKVVKPGTPNKQNK